MRKITILAAILFCFSAIQTAVAQNPITTLVHAGTTTVYYGQSSFVDAYTASVNGDYLYLSPGYFTAPADIAKGVNIIGAGHFPDSANVAKRTTIMSTMYINSGADSLKLEGLYINGNIQYENKSVNYIKVKRCNLGDISFLSYSEGAKKNFCSYEECFIRGSIFFSKYGNNLLIKNNIINGYISDINGGAVIDGNIFLINSGSSLFNSVYSSVIKNNISIMSVSASILSASTGNTLSNNLFSKSSIDLSNNFSNNNYTGIAQANIFVNQTGNAIDYTHDYHLKSPTTYLATDGTQVGLYGGVTPFKEKGLPSNPQILTKTVGNQTDSNGNLQINFKVKAQDN